MHLQRRAQAVSRMYRRLDLQSRSFRLSSGLKCLPGCGDCCLSPGVEATVLEMLPAAFQLERDGSLERSLELLEGEPAPRVCLLHLPEPPAAAAGHCGLYACRPLVCRLFGFSAVLNKDGRRELATCRLIRAAQAGPAARADQEVGAGAALAPLMGSYRMELFGIDPSLGARPLPINRALAQALQMVGLDRRRWSRQAG